MYDDDAHIENFRKYAHIEYKLRWEKRAENKTIKKKKERTVQNGFSMLFMTPQKEL